MYGLVADGTGARFDPSKVLLDPLATAVVFPPEHSRRAAGEPRRTERRARAPVARATPWPSPARAAAVEPSAGRVRGARARHDGRRRPSSTRARISRLIGELDRIAALGFSVIELLPVHQNDPQEGSYWGYMPLAFGAVHEQYAAGGDAPASSPS